MENKYKLINGIDKKCVTTCLPQKQYHLPGDGNECLGECPDFAKFHKNGDVVCYNEKGLKDNTDCKSIVYSSKEGFTTKECETNYSSLHSESGLIICLDKCIPEYGEYLTPFNTCVKDCIADLPGQHFINDIQNKKCICENFYFFNDSNLMECIPNSVGKKKCKYVNDIYNVSMFDSKQCIKKNTCKNNKDILSPSEDICYDKSYNDKCSSLIDKNSVHKSALSKCECLNKFYYTPEEKGVQKICLDKNGECPSEYKYFVPYF